MTYFCDEYINYLKTHNLLKYMAEVIILPKQGQSVESCIITELKKQKGDTVNEGDVLFTYETDKASFEEVSPSSGIVLEVFHKEGDEVPVLMNMMVIGQPGETGDWNTEVKPEQASSSALPHRSAPWEKGTQHPRRERLARSACRPPWLRRCSPTRGRQRLPFSPCQDTAGRFPPAFPTR